MTYTLTLQPFVFKEISIGIYVPDKTQVKELYERQKSINNTTLFPYWAKVWPAAYAMAQFLIDHPHYIANKNVMEFAAGLGLPSLVAAKYAATVYCTDHIADAVKVVEQSITYNSLTNIKAITADWRQLPPQINADVILLSDINYEPEMFDALYAMLTRFLNNGVIIILSTPQRLMAKSFIDSLLSFVIQQENTDIEESGLFVPVSVLVLKYK